MDFLDFEDLVNLEQKFYDEGFKEGYDHGKIHGMIEGRTLGGQKGFEIWEELGYYEGFAICWKNLMVANSSSGRESGGQVVKEGNETSKTHSDRVLNQLDQLISSIAKFPVENPSDSSTAVGIKENDLVGGTEILQIRSETETAPHKEEIDLVRQLAHIRSRYKLLCSSIGIKPRLIPAPSSSLASDSPAAEGTAPRDDPKLNSGSIEVQIEQNEIPAAEETQERAVADTPVKSKKKRIWSMQKGGQSKDPPLTPGSLSF